MSVRKFLLKVKTTTPKLFLGILLLGIGAALICIHRYPGVISNGVAWLESEGMDIALSVGLALILIGAWVLSSFLKQLFTHRITFTKGPVAISLESGLLEQTVQHLWFEYFDRSDLRTYVSMHGNHINITGETPEEWDNIDDLCSFLSHKLLSFTGYWGDLCLQTAPKAKAND